MSSCGPGGGVALFLHEFTNNIYVISYFLLSHLFFNIFLFRGEVKHSLKNMWLNKYMTFVPSVEEKR